MELVALVWGLAQIVGTGALVKVGKNILDVAVPKVRELEIAHAQAVEIS